MSYRPVPVARWLAGLCLAGIVSAPANARDCWAELFDQANFEGRRVHVEGPAELASLTRLQGEDWSSRIESLQVGPDAELVAYRKPNFEEDLSGPVNHPHAFSSWGRQELPAYRDEEISFGPGAKEHHLGELNFHRNINSLKLRCRR